MISEFRGEYAFLSNFYHCKVPYMGLVFKSAEAAFQAAKCPKMAKEFVGIDPSRAKAKGRHVPLRPDWEAVKDKIMYDILMAKFTHNRDLQAKLLKTGDQVLQEGNTWGDVYWGVCDGKGKNTLGQLLMKVRFELNVKLSRADPKWL